MAFVAFLVVGVFTGTVVTLFLSKRSLPSWVEIAIGVTGAAAGGLLFRAITRPLGFEPMQLVAAFVGAMIATVMAHSVREPMGSN